MQTRAELRRPLLPVQSVPDAILFRAGARVDRRLPLPLHPTPERFLRSCRIPPSKSQLCAPLACVKVLMLQQTIIIAISHARDERSFTFPQVQQFLVDLLKYNDNAQNNVSTSRAHAEQSLMSFLSSLMPTTSRLSSLHSAILSSQALRASRVI